MGPPERSRIDSALADARAHLTRLSAEEAWRRSLAGQALLVDTRTSEQRATQGDLPGALVIDRTVLEWRLDPTSSSSIPEAADGTQLIVVCCQGYSSSLAAKSLQDLGLDATDVIGGMEAWLAAGMPTDSGPADVRH